MIKRLTGQEAVVGIAGCRSERVQIYPNPTKYLSGTNSIR